MKAANLLLFIRPPRYPQQTLKFVDLMHKKPNEFMKLMIKNTTLVDQVRSALKKQNSRSYDQVIEKLRDLLKEPDILCNTKSWSLSYRLDENKKNILKELVMSSNNDKLNNSYDAALLNFSINRGFQIDAHNDYIFSI